MTRQRKLITLTIISIISTFLSFFAPLAKETTQGLFNTYTDTVSLFDGVDSGLCIALTVIAGICLILFTCISLLRGSGSKGIVGARWSGIALLVMQIICTVQALNYYDDSSLFGAFRSEISEMTIHPLAIVTMVITLIAIIMCFNQKTTE